MNLSRSLLLGALVLTACSDPDPTPTPDAGVTPDAGTAQSCDDIQRTGPTVHDSGITQDETWTAAGSPHIVMYATRLSSGVTLTIEPCATVLFKQDASLDLTSSSSSPGATLKAEGTQDKPIQFAGEAGARWKALSVYHPSRAILRYVKFSDGGGDTLSNNATVYVRGDQQTPVKKPVLFDHVTIEKSQGPGVALARSSGFETGSTDLVVTQSGSASAPSPVVIGEHGIGSVPTGTYTGNVQDEILIVPSATNGLSGLQEDATMRDRGVPYRFGQSSLDVFQVGGTTTPATTLTVEPGVTLRFTPGTRMRIGKTGGLEPATGTLVAVGTATQPITFTSAAATPAPGDWVGLWYSGTPNSGNRLEHAVVSYTGHDCSCSLPTCTDTALDEAAIIFASGQPASAFIQNTRLTQGSGHGIFRGWQGEATPDFLATNTFESLAGCAQTNPAPLSGSCTAPRQTCP